MNIKKQAPTAAAKAERKRTRNGSATSAPSIWVVAVTEAYADEVKAGTAFEQVLDPTVVEWANGITPTKATTRAKAIGNALRSAKPDALRDWVTEVRTTEANAKATTEDYVVFRPMSDAEKARAEKARGSKRTPKAEPKQTARKRTPKAK